MTLLQRKLTKNAFADQGKLLDINGVHTIFDVGANIGAVTKIYASRFLRATIHAFEPSPETYALLESNFGNVKSVRTHNLAVADHTGNVNFNVNFNSGTSSILTPSEYNSKTWAIKGKQGVISVPSTTLDDFCTFNGIERIDILKMDAEGAEMKILQGAKKLLSSAAIQLIYTEVSLVPLYERQPLLHDLTDHLLHYDYHLFNVYDIVESPISQGLLTNAIYLGPHLRRDLKAQWGTSNCGW